MYKMIETVESQIYRFVVGPNPGGVPIPDKQKIAGVDLNVQNVRAFLDST